MAHSMYAINKPGRAKTSLDTKPDPLSKYEYLGVSLGTEEISGRKPVKRNIDKRQGKTKSESNRRTLKLRRRRDGKVFRAAEYVDGTDLIEDAKEILLQVLNHPNIICLIDVVQAKNAGSTAKAYTVWEDCNRGTLNRLLWHEPGQNQVELPEGLCWHVLDGISNALLWLHYGCKHTFLSDYNMDHGDDWHRILMTEINPSKIYFTASQGDETFGDVKLGGFESAKIYPLPKSVKGIPNLRVNRDGLYIAPEVGSHGQAVSAASDIWALGAVLYHMMVGEPPTQVDLSSQTTTPNRDDFWVKALPARFTAPLKEIVRSMLRTNRDDRPTADDLTATVEEHMKAWRESTAEGRRFVAKGEFKDQAKVPVRL